MIEAIGIVVPAHDEEELLPACLAALDKARGLVGIPTKLVVVLDSCTDDSAAIAGEDGLVVHHRCVGRARADGVLAVLRHFREVPLDRIWLAMTDADSRVPETWLARQLSLASAAVGVAGTVTVDDWGDFPAHRIGSYEARYAAEEGHIHGANMGVRADAYLAVGGFPPVATSEDVALWSALRLRRYPLVTTTSNPVVTSARLEARAPDGFAAFLRNWAA